MLFQNASAWLAVGFVACMVLAALLAVLARIGILKLPDRVFIIIVVVGMAQMVALLKLMNLGDDKRRQELRRVNPTIVSNVSLESVGQSIAIKNTNEICLLFSEIQALKSMSAHHSHPTKRFDITFLKDNRQYRYRVGQDSQNSDEFWIFRLGDDGIEHREIGRVQSAHLEPMLERLLTNKP